MVLNKGFAMKLLFAITMTLFSVSSQVIAQEFEIKIVRNMTCNDGSTIGRLFIQGKEIGQSLELPWRNNRKWISRIPAGTYPAKIRADGKRKK